MGLFPITYYFAHTCNQQMHQVHAIDSLDATWKTSFYLLKKARNEKDQTVKIILRKLLCRHLLIKK